MENSQEEKAPKVEFVEREINLSLINEKLNYIMAKLEKL
jgi:hypothetical protein